jgi:aspartate/methionine/tyrosine aminotransferase
LRAEDGWRIDVGALERTVTSASPAVTALVINTPHNPTGAHLTSDELTRVARLCDERGITLISDEVYRFLEHDDADTLPGAASLTPRAMSIGVLSKAFGLAGLRIGWLATRDRARLATIAAYKDYTTICASAPSEILAIAALRQRAQIIARNRGIVLANLARAHAFTSAHSGQLTWTPPRAGCVAIARLVGDVAQRWPDTGAFADHAAQAHGVLVMPARVFGRAGAELRIGLGRLDFADGLLRLARALDARPA